MKCSKYHNRQPMQTQMVLFLPPAQMFYRSNDWAPAVHFDCNFNYFM